MCIRDSIPTDPVIMESLTQYISITTFVSNEESDAAEYQCTAYVSSNSSFVNNSASVTGAEKIEIG